MEDFKVVHAHTGIRKMISFEMDVNTFSRQKFNRPLNCIKLENLKSTDFVMNYEFLEETVVWLDFTSPSQLKSDLDDVYELMGKLKRGDIVKVTLNSHAGSIPCKKKIGLDVLESRFEFLENLLGDYFPTDIKPEMLSKENYSNALFKILELVFDKAIGGTHNNYFQPLTSFVYADGQQMMTFTGIILDRGETKSFFDKTDIKKWNLSIINKNEPIFINVPELSVKERMLLDSLLPNYTAKKIHKRLRYLLAEDEKDSLAGIENYVRYYKQFPYFSKVLF